VISEIHIYVEGGNPFYYLRESIRPVEKEGKKEKRRRKKESSHYARRFDLVLQPSRRLLFWLRRKMGGGEGQRKKERKKRHFSDGEELLTKDRARTCAHLMHAEGAGCA